MINEQYKKVNREHARHIVKKWAGHTTSEMLNRIYLHVNNDFEQAQIVKFNKGGGIIRDFISKAPNQDKMKTSSKS